MYMKSYTLLALLAATMIGTTDAVQLTSAGDAASLAGAGDDLEISDSKIVKALFDGARAKVKDGTLGDAAAVAANGAAPGTGPLAEYAVDTYGEETLTAA